MTGTKEILVGLNDSNSSRADLVIGEDGGRNRRDVESAIALRAYSG